MFKKEDNYSYKGWLISDHLIKRILAVLGYSIMGQILISVAILLVTSILAVMLMMIGAIA